MRRLFNDFAIDRVYFRFQMSPRHILLHAHAIHRCLGIPLMAIYVGLGAIDCRFIGHAGLR